MSRKGQYIEHSIGDETVRAYVPPSLPFDPPIRTDRLLGCMEKANQALGRLDALASLLPDTRIFIYYYVRKEAVLSSQIEGTQSSLSDLLLYESSQQLGVPLDVEEVSSYVAALDHGLKRLREGFPISLRLIREVHEVLLAKGRGSSKAPGEFRRTQNWIGGTRPGNAIFVPPPVERLIECLDNLEKFIHNYYGEFPSLMKAAISHVQFETIHPFLDGNGRVGRLLITLLLCSEGILSEPILYLSLYFKTHRTQYYEALQRVRIEGDWENWYEFFLEGVRRTATQAVESSKQILTLFKNDREILLAPSGTSVYAKSHSISLQKVHDALKEKPIVSITQAASLAGMSFPTTRDALATLEKANIVKEITGKQRGRVYVYQEYINILQSGTEPLPS